MNYITPEEIMTYLPKEVRESESKADLISYIIRGYRRMKLPQDKDYRELLIQTTNGNYTIPDNVKSISSVEYVIPVESDEEAYYQTVPVYPTVVQSDLCTDARRCSGDCSLKYSIVERTLRLPTLGTYRLIYAQLYSDSLLVLDDETLIDYLAAYATWQVTYNRSRTSDVTQNMLQLDLQLMNNLYTAARGAVIMKSINLASHKLNTKQLNISYDELNYRYDSTSTA